VASSFEATHRACSERKSIRRLFSKRDPQAVLGGCAAALIEHRYALSAPNAATFLLV
jgi:hypothetical protein